jgi:hypothetical protein
MPTIRKREKEQPAPGPGSACRAAIAQVVPGCGRVVSRRREMLLLRGQIIASRSVRGSSSNGKCDSTENRQPWPGHRAYI